MNKLIIAVLVAMLLSGCSKQEKPILDNGDAQVNPPISVPESPPSSEDSNETSGPSGSQSSNNNGDASDSSSGDNKPPVTSETVTDDKEDAPKPTLPETPVIVPEEKPVTDGNGDAPVAKPEGGSNSSAETGGNPTEDKEKEPVITTKEDFYYIEVPFKEVLRENPNIDWGKQVVAQQGVKGKTKVVATYTYKDGVLESVVEKKIVETKSVDKIVELGTKEVISFNKAISDTVMNMVNDYRVANGKAEIIRNDDAYDAMVLRAPQLKDDFSTQVDGNNQKFEIIGQGFLTAREVFDEWKINPESSQLLLSEDISSGNVVIITINGAAYSLFWGLE